MYYNFLKNIAETGKNMKQPIVFLILVVLGIMPNESNGAAYKSEKVKLFEKDPKSFWGCIFCCTPVKRGKEKSCDGCLAGIGNIIDSDLLAYLNVIELEHSGCAPIAPLISASERMKAGMESNKVYIYRGVLEKDGKKEHVWVSDFVTSEINPPGRAIDVRLFSRILSQNLGQATEKYLNEEPENISARYPCLPPGSAIKKAKK